LYQKLILWGYCGADCRLCHTNEKKGLQTMLQPLNFFQDKWCRGTESNCRHGDFQTNIFEIENCRNFNQLILFQFFNLLLVSFGTIWKYLTLTGTIWAQFSSLQTYFCHPPLHQNLILSTWSTQWSLFEFQAKTHTAKRPNMASMILAIIIYSPAPSTPSHI